MSFVVPGRWRAPVLGLYRLVTGVLFACHGAAGLFGAFPGAQAGQAAFPQWPGWWAALIELAGGALVAVGLFTRPAALVSSGAMAYAYFSVHQPHALWPIENHGEPAVLFCWAFLLIAVTGPGHYSLDRLLGHARIGRTAGTRPPRATAGAG
ncbi:MULTISPECIES: DoxX family protein [Streptomycetaceae]|uniref:DoxX family protein n=1 Tax=Streptantibioticus cattleyicolor (strain ATCC 35852 / DSM 46488 / JCM 4925 / NBRC 14057 / NRRL 8057) TaxID=1003195 RepID=F8JT63_STREN|nr:MULTISPECIES: DoxX family protein [Streptomycetaceae]AEW93011.1 DoxX family protein [Streptantibioticus cattleyicolor NRRL 8057 = DSM 46488]MYS57747.1 DoxX family membrane protein [Streptomyces sp. SID5468]CCB73371.1 putative integral membrane protein [Streptantibioticus cattleyicolor NRRL 8057 = DSM 46488]